MSRRAQVLDSLSQAVAALLLRDPFYAHVVMNLRRRVADDVDTAAVTVVGGQPWLLVNEGFWLDTLQDDNLKRGILRHEILHIVLGHLVRHQAFTDKLKFNIAADLAVNSLIPRSELPANALTAVMRFPVQVENRRFHLKVGDRVSGQTAEWYYQRLAEPSDPDVDAQVAILFGAGCERWEGDPGPIGSALAAAIQSAIRSMGPSCVSSLPPQLRNAIDAIGLSGRQVLDWRRALRCFSGRSRRTRLVTTLKRPSKRFGSTPGVRVRSKSHVVVAVDTSGSIDQQCLGRFFEQVHAIWRTGATVTILEADNEVRGVSEYRGKAIQPKGGGGTDFDPAIKWVNERANIVDALVYFTDADGARTVPCRKRMMWLVHRQGGGSERPNCANAGEMVFWMGDDQDTG